MRLCETVLYMSESLFIFRLILLMTFSFTFGYLTGWIVGKRRK